jgi:hypothetical protein
MRHLKAVASIDELAQLGAYIFLALAGRPVAVLVTLMRALLSRLTDAPAPVRTNLEWWIRAITGHDRNNRWYHLYFFFLIGQLPGFRMHLHCLHLVQVPDFCLPWVRSHWCHFKIEVRRWSSPRGPRNSSASSCSPSTCCRS